MKLTVKLQALQEKKRKNLEEKRKKLFENFLIFYFYIKYYYLNTFE